MIIDAKNVENELVKNTMKITETKYNKELKNTKKTIKKK